jgi:hypothetical protein
MARAEKKIHYLYKTTCLITNRYYIGIHSTNNLDDGYMGSGKRLRYSIRKHGVENHVKEILEFFETREDLTKREIEIVNSDLIKEVNCMNLVLGGGGFMLDDYHYKCSKAGGNVHAKRLIEDDNYLKLHKDKFITIIKERHKNGCYKYDTFTGKKHSDESKKKMSESSKGSGTGETNSQYGTCWITKDCVNKKIKKEDLDIYLNEGWVKGRKY